MEVALMLSPKRMDARGQASFEFILVLMFVLTIVIVLIVPLGQTTQQAMEDVFRASTVASNLRSVDNAISLARIQGAASQQTFSLYLPKDSNVDCHISTGANDPAQVRFAIQFSKKVFDAGGSVPAGCIDLGAASTQMTCTKSVRIPSNFIFTCQGAAQDYSINAADRGYAQPFRLNYIPSTVAPFIPTIDFSVG
jgi:uncharacterized protein (UPF0333 family)